MCLNKCLFVDKLGHLWVRKLWFSWNRLLAIPKAIFQSLSVDGRLGIYKESDLLGHPPLICSALFLRFFYTNIKSEHWVRWNSCSSAHCTWRAVSPSWTEERNRAVTVFHTFQSLGKPGNKTSTFTVFIRIGTARRNAGNIYCSGEVALRWPFLILFVPLLAFIAKNYWFFQECTVE